MMPFQSDKQKKILFILAVLTSVNVLLNLGKRSLLCVLRRKKKKFLLKEIEEFLESLAKIPNLQDVVVDYSGEERCQSDHLSEIVSRKNETHSSTLSSRFPTCSDGISAPLMVKKNSTLCHESQSVVRIPINSLQKIVVIPMSALPAEEFVRELYCYACICFAPAVYLVDLWNILCSLICHEYQNNSSNASLITNINFDVHYRANLLATTHLLRGQYALNKYVKPSVIRKNDFSVVTFPFQLAEENKIFDSSKWSQICTYLHYQLCTIKKPLHQVLCLIFLDSGFFRVFRWGMCSTLKTVLLADIIGGCAAQQDKKVSSNGSLSENYEQSSGACWTAVRYFSYFLSKVFQRSSGKLIVFQNLMVGGEWIVSCFQDDLRKKMIANENRELESTSLFALSIQNFIPSYSWTLPSLVETAVEACTAFSEDGINFVLNNTMNFVEDVTAGLRYPLQCAVGWSATQFIRFLENKLFYIAALIAHCSYSFDDHVPSHPTHIPSATRSPSVQHKQDNDDLEQNDDFASTNFGLSLLLLVCGEKQKFVNDGKSVFPSLFSKTFVPGVSPMKANELCSVALFSLVFLLVFPCESSCIIQNISLPLCKFLISFFEIQKKIAVESVQITQFDEIIYYFSTIWEDLQDELGSGAVPVDLSVSSDLFLLLHCRGISFCPSSRSSFDPSFFGGPLQACLSSPNARKTVFDALEQCIGRADGIPLSLAFAVSNSMLSSSQKNFGGVEVEERENASISSRIFSCFMSSFTSLSPLAFVSACDNIHLFSERFYPIVSPSEVFMRRLGSLIQYEHSLQRKGECSYSFHMNLLQSLRQVSSGSSAVRHPPTLIDHRLWRESAPLLETSWSVEFQNVCFAYPNTSTLVLNNVSFRVKKGEKLGIIGYSGAGKTTILLLINRIYAPTSGSILINDVPIHEYAARPYRRRVCFSFQYTNSSRFFERMSIRSNISLGDLVNANAKKIADSLQISDALKMIQCRGEGLEGMLDFRKFSGGELDRLILARSVLRSIHHCSLFMLDESMSALDSLTEEFITKSLDEHWARKGSLEKVPFTRKENSCAKDEFCRPTIITVTHRLYSVRDCDLLLLIEDGKVKESGTWSELNQCSSNEYFHKILRSQLLHSFSSQ